MRAVSSLVAVSMMACPVAAPPDGGADAGWALTETQAVSGTRLRARYLVPESGGGAKRFVGFQDTQRHEPCVATPLGSEGWACLPQDLQLFFPEYEDAACTTPLAWRTPRPTGSVKPYDEPAYTSLVVPPVVLTPCATPTGTRVYKLSPRGAPTRLFSAQTGTCSEVSGAVPQGVEWFVGQEIPLQSFVSFSVVSEARGALEARVLVSADGARQLHRVHLSGGDAPLEAQLTPDAGLRWLPPPQGYFAPGQIFGDATCSRPAALVGQACAGRSSPPLLATLFDGACGGEVTFGRVKVGAVVGTAYVEGQGTCQARAPEPAEPVVLLVGEQVPNTDFPAANERLEGTRLKFPVLVDAEARALLPSGFAFLDGSPGVRCFPRTLRTAGLRCVPSADARLEEVWVDAACQQPALAMPPPASGCSPSRPPVVELYRAGELDGAAPRLFKPGAPLPLTSPLYGRDPAGACQVVTRAPDFSYSALTSTPNTMLEALTLVTE